MTQEELAALCNVSRQSISKWEADIALPELDKLLVLSETFHVSLDVLVKDELTMNDVKEVHTCGDNALGKKKVEVYEGTLVKESIEDDSVLDFKSGNEKYVVFRDKVLKYQIGNKAEKAALCEECRVSIRMRPSTMRTGSWCEKIIKNS